MAPRLALLVLLGLQPLLALPGCASWRLGAPRLTAPPPPEQSGAARERATRHALEDARAFYLQGRLDAAERAARRGLALRPDDARLLRFRARLLEDRGRSEPAAELRRRADAVDPPPPPLPQVPLDGRGRGLAVLLLPPPLEDADRAHLPETWPDAVVAATLERRLAVRLPEARVLHADPATLREAAARLADLEARAALSLQVARADCDVSVKDGHFAVAVLRSAAEARGEPGPEPAWVRAVRDDPPAGDDCPTEATARALEGVLARDALDRARAARPPADADWSRPALRALFPALGVRIRAELDQGERWLASGHLALAEESFERAARIDPEDPQVRTYLDEVRATLALADQLDGAAGSGGELPPRFSEPQRAALEAQLRAERHRREDLLAALAVLDEDVRPPAPEALARLRPVPIAEPEAFGPGLARAAAEGPVEARVAYAPDGSVLSRYYFAEGGRAPLLREEDTRGDGRPDRWIRYAAGARLEIFEAGRGRGRPDVRIVFAPGGTRLERIEIDADLDGRPNRIFQYADGRLRVESRDTSDDGVLDRFDRFDERGRVVMREEDRDDDGRIDVRSIYRAGKLVRRELADPSLAPGGT